MGFLHMGHTSSEEEHSMHVPWPHMKATLRTFSRQMAHILASSISLTCACSESREWSVSRYFSSFSLNSAAGSTAAASVETGELSVFSDKLSKAEGIWQRLWRVVRRAWESSQTSARVCILWDYMGIDEPVWGLLLQRPESLDFESAWNLLFKRVLEFELFESASNLLFERALEFELFESASNLLFKRALEFELFESAWNLLFKWALEFELFESAWNLQIKREW